MPGRKPSTDLNGLPPHIAARILFESFKRPTRTPVGTVQVPVMAAAERGTIDVGGVGIATYRWGSGSRRALLVHGWNSRASDFHAFVAPLTAAGFTVVAFDNPGHGESGGDTATVLDVREVMLVLQRDSGPFDAVVAHSLGALYAVYALSHGVHAGRLVALSSVCDFSYLITRFTAAMQLRQEIVDLLRGHVEALFEDDDIWTRFSADTNVRGMAGRVCLIHDDLDDFVERWQSDKLHAALDGAGRLHVTHGLGHRRILGDPDVLRLTIDSLTAEDDG